jgi:protein-tyrosine-phosphatase
MIQFISSTIGEYFRIFTKREVHDVFVIDDLSPVWQELRIILCDIFTRLSTHLSVWGRFRDRLLLKKTLRLQDIAEIAVVCQGNICRSPFAAALLEKVLGQAAMPRFRVRSYGNLPREGITSPANALQAAKSYGIDLARHCSRHFTHEAATKAQLIIVFDEINRRWICERYPTLSAPIVFLGSFGPHDRMIADPDGGSRTQFEQTYALIAEATTGLAARICNG